MLLDVKDLSRSRWLVLESIERKPVCRWSKAGIGWKKIRFQNRWFQLFGGIRGGFFIDVSNPIADAPKGGEG